MKPNNLISSVLLLFSTAIPQATFACSSMQRILQGGPLPFASDGTRFISGGEYFYPDFNAPHRTLRTIVIIYSDTTKKLTIFRSGEGIALPNNIKAVALSPDSVFINGVKGVLKRHDDDTSWHTLPGVENEQVTALAWIGRELWIGTSKDLLIYNGGSIRKSISLNKYFKGDSIISILPVGNKVLIGTHRPPPKASILDNCSQLMGKSNPEGFHGFAYIGNIAGTQFTKFDPNGIFSNEAKPRVLFDIFPSTTPGQLMVIAGDGTDTTSVEVTTSDIGLSNTPAPSGLHMEHYNPFLAVIAKVKAQESKKAESAVADYLKQSFQDLPSGAKLWGFGAQFTLWALNGEWGNFTKLQSTKRLWAASFLAEYPNPKATQALLDLIKETGASVGIIQAIDKTKNKVTEDILARILGMEFPFAKPSEDKTTKLADTREPKVILEVAARSLQMRKGPDPAKILANLLNSRRDLSEEIEMTVRQVLHDLAQEKWVLYDAAITMHLKREDFPDRTSPPDLIMGKNNRRPVRGASVYFWNDISGTYVVIVKLPLKGEYTLHYGKSSKKSITFMIDKRKIDLGSLN